nr:hypothetical protein [uncultured Flavobacterium sp.]
MKPYYYLLFRIYSSLNDPKKQNDARTINILLTNTSSLLIWLICYEMIVYLSYYCFNISDLIIPNKFFVLFYMLLIWIINYYYFIKGKKFLNYNFKTDKKGGYAIIGFIAILALSFVFIANKNREKIFKEREKARTESKQ